MIETPISIIRTKNKDDALLKKFFPHKSEKKILHTIRKPRCGKYLIKQRMKNKVLFPRGYRFEDNKESKTVVDRLNLNLKKWSSKWEP